MLRSGPTYNIIEIITNVKKIIIQTSEQKWVYFDYGVPCLANRGRRVSVSAVPIILTGILCLVVTIFVW